MRETSASLAVKAPEQLRVRYTFGTLMVIVAASHALLHKVTGR